MGRILDYYFDSVVRIVGARRFGGGEYGKILSFPIYIVLYCIWRISLIFMCIKRTYEIG